MRNRFFLISILLLLIAGACGVCVMAGALNTPGGARPGPTLAQSPTPATPEERLKAAVRGSVGPERGVEVEIANGAINVRFDIADNLSEQMIRDGAKIDMTAMLKALAADGYRPYRFVGFEGRFTLVDKFGRAHEESVVWTTYELATVDKINWERFSWRDIYEVADTLKLHPAFEE